MRLGIGTYAFTWAIGVPGHIPPRPLTALDLLHEAKRLGVGVVQFCDNLPLTTLSDAELGWFHAEAKACGISLELGTRGLEAGNLRRYLGLCRRFGCSFLRVVIHRPGDEPSAEEAVARLKPLLRHCARKTLDVSDAQAGH
jgi:hypothetical protein